MHQAYEFVKAKSEWVSPNMGLIYQLVEWEKKLKGGAEKRSADDMDMDDVLQDPSNSPTASNSSTDSRLATPANQLYDQSFIAPSPTFANELLSPSMADMIISPQVRPGELKRAAS